VVVENFYFIIIFTGLCEAVIIRRVMFMERKTNKETNDNPKTKSMK